MESHAATLASSPALFTALGEMDLARCPVRAQLMKVLVHGKGRRGGGWKGISVLHVHLLLQVLVFIGAAANSDDLRKNMFNQVWAV